MSMEPVSYTHLDVYKRQVKRRDLSVELREGLGEVVLDVFRELLEVHALVVAVEYGEEIRVEEQQLEMCIRDSIMLSSGAC